MTELKQFDDIFDHMRAQLNPNYVQISNAVHIRCLQRNVSREDAVKALVLIQQDLEARSPNVYSSYMQHVDK